MSIVYILVSKQQPQRYYIGLTDDLERRLKEHNKAKAGYTKRYAPWKVETHIIFSDKELAETFEKYLKSGSGNAFLKKRLIKQARRYKPAMVEKGSTKPYNMFLIKAK